ncbi:hypothetical protein HHK36_003932 [Tetracentron sinense]|uniref:Pesticidal crystal cry8Ba protein n=1 Tax=Tetracentron sinense TaxID=13715 RepID=A0A834ZUA3_TETSI|nr:hypothetical protein HHK36_003932 [Tetracentron sinense]
MFTEGLDNNALRWVREGTGSKQKEVPFSISNQRPRIDPVTNIRSGGRGFGLPPPTKFRSGHLPSGVIPVPRAIPKDADDSGSGSDMDVTTDTEDEIYGGRYSLDSSPQDDRIPNGATHRYTTPLRRQPHYASDQVYSDFSSSRDTVGQRQGNGVVRPGGGGGRHPVGQDGYVEDESSDSAASSEFSSTQVGSINGAGPHRGAYTSEGYSSSIPSRANVAEKDFHARGLQNKRLSDDDVPSAPPFIGSGQEINQDAQQIPTSRAHGTPSTTNTNGFSSRNEPNTWKSMSSGITAQDNPGNRIPDKAERTTAGAETAASLGSLPARLPTFHASGQGPWYAVISYDACVRLCLHSWARGCMEAPPFLENECALLRNAFGLQQILLQSEEELLEKRSSELISEGAAPKPKKTNGKMKVQVRKVKMALDPPTGCSFSSMKPPMIKLESLRYRFSNLQSTLSSGWEALQKIRVVPRLPPNGSFSRHSLAYVHASTRYIKQVSGLLKIGVTTLRNSSTSYDVVQETYSCLLRLKSSTEEDAVRMQPGSGETHVFFPDNLGDDLIVEVQDSKGKYYGRVLAQVATIAEDPGDKLRWWSIYHEPEHELVGKIQLYINYSNSPDENNHLKCGSVAETVAYDLVLEVAMKAQHFQQRNLLLYGPWKWLLTEFASYYGVSDAYTKLRYLSYVMDVATPTADCLVLVHDLLLPVVMKGHSRSTLSHQENRILGEIEDQIEQILALAFENYKSLDESSPSGMMDVFRPATGSAALALSPAVKLYTLLHDILSPETQLKLCSYFQAAAKKRSRRHLAETDEFVTSNNEGMLMDAMTISTSYQKMKSLCLNIRNEVFTDIEIHNQHVLPSFVDLPNLSSSIYSAELCSRLRAFLVACPPTGPSPPVAELVIAAADFQRDLASWNINPIKGGVDAKELFHLYIILWIQDKRLSLLESCKLDKILYLNIDVSLPFAQISKPQKTVCMLILLVKWSGVRTQHSTTPFVDDMYDRLKETLNEYEIIICRWPEYTFVLENAIADVEKAVVETLDKQYADVLSPLKDNLTPKKFGLKYVQKLAKRSVSAYTVPEELGILLNSMKRMLDVLRPKVESQLKSWGSCIPDGGNSVSGERLSEITVMLRAKFRNYLQAVVEKLAENVGILLKTRLQSATKLKKIIQDSKETVVESDVRSRMQPLKDQVTKTIDHLHSIFETHVFIAICRGYWDQMGQARCTEFLGEQEREQILVQRLTSFSGYVYIPAMRKQVGLILDDTFASQMQQLLGNALQEKDLEPPRSIMEVRSMLCKDAPNHKDNNYYY